MFSNNKFLSRLWLFALLAAPIVLWILPAGFFDDGKVITCPSRLFFGIECLGCGMTRAVMHMHHLEFADALYYNTGVVVVFPALVIFWFYLVYKAARNSGLPLPGSFGKPVGQNP